MDSGENAGENRKALKMPTGGTSASPHNQSGTSQYKHQWMQNAFAGVEAFMACLQKCSENPSSNAKDSDAFEGSDVCSI